MKFVTALLVLLLAGPAHSLSVLRVCGESILNECGEEVFLRGVNMDLHYSRVWDDPDAPFHYASDEDMDLLAEMGCNSIRMCLHWKLFMTSAGFDLIDTYLEWCKPRGIYLILDMHRPPLDNVTGGSGIWSSSEAQDSLCSIWLGISDRYSGEPGIAGYDLVNEPGPSDYDVWWNLAQRLADSLRANGDDHILFVETRGGGLYDLRLIEDDNTAYSVHCYDPFTITHAGASWPGDSPVASNSSYPGDILTGVEYLGWSSGVPRLTERTGGWTEWSSGPVIIPEWAPLVSVKAFVTGNTGRVQFDGFSLFINGAEREVMNGDIEDVSRKRPGEPSNWIFYNNGNYTGSGEDGYGNGRCLEVDGSRGSASWIQTKGYYTAPLFNVEPGDTVMVTAMIRAPRNRGEIALGLDYVRVKREYWDIDSLRDVIRETVNWASRNEVPVYVGEFGSMTAAGVHSRNDLISDWITVMNEENMHWSLWTYRTFGGPSFGIFYNDSILDETFAATLEAGFRSR